MFIWLIPLQPLNTFLGVSQEVFQICIPTIIEFYRRWRVTTLILKLVNDMHK